jgi:hypothetical protein
VIGASKVVGLAACQMEADRVAKCVHYGVNLGAQAAAGTPYRLVLRHVFWAPALC